MKTDRVCGKCGGRLAITVSSKEHPYSYEVLGGLKNVELIGVRKTECVKCGEGSVEVPSPGQLHRVIAHMLFHKPGVLSGDEVRFLRKNAGLMAKDFAAFVRIEPETLSRIENDKTPIGESTDKLARAVAMAPCSDTQEFRDFLLTAAKETTVKKQRAKVTFQLKGDAWATAGAAA